MPIPCLKTRIQITSDIKDCQMIWDTCPPKLLLLYLWPPMVTIWSIWYNGCMICMIETPSVCNPLSWTPTMSSCMIIKLGEKSPLEWSMTRHIVSESSLGTAWTGKSSILNDSEKHLVAILVQTCSSRKSHSCSLFGRHHNPSHDFGYPSFIMSANGQNPSCNPTKTESTKAQFGWLVSSFSNTLTSILQMILNRSGQSNIITCLTGWLSTIGLGCGKGFVVSEYPVVGPNSSSLTFHRYFLACFSLSPLAWYHSSLFACTFLLSMSLPSTSNANVSVLTLRGLFSTLLLIEQLAWVFTLPCGHSSTLSCGQSLLISLLTLVPCCFTEDISHFKESELLKLVKWHIVNRSRPAMDRLVKVENPVLPSCIGRHKVSSNVLTVSYEFWLSVGVDEPHCMLEHAVHDKPIPVVPDCFGWFQMSKSEFKVPGRLSCLVVSDGQVDRWGDNIKVNCLSLQYYDPLGVWKLW